MITLEILLLITVLALAPSILVLMTSFTRIIVVFSFLRNALGTRQTPTNQILIGLSLFLTFFIMEPVFKDIYNYALQPYMNGEIGYEEMFKRAMVPIRGFMIKQIKIHHNEDNIDMLLESLKRPKVKNIEDTPTSVLIPAFVISELEIAFKMGILLYIPFILVDMIVASILLAMGMIMVPPVLVSLPSKSSYSFWSTVGICSCPVSYEVSNPHHCLPETSSSRAFVSCSSNSDPHQVSAVKMLPLLLPTLDS